MVCVREGTKNMGACQPDAHLRRRACSCWPAAGAARSASALGGGGGREGGGRGGEEAVEGGAPVEAAMKNEKLTASALGRPPPLSWRSIRHATAWLSTFWMVGNQRKHACMSGAIWPGGTVHNGWYEHNSPSRFPAPSRLSKGARAPSAATPWWRPGGADAGAHETSDQTLLPAAAELRQPRHPARP